MKEIHRTQFEPIGDSRPDKLAVGSYGLPGAGKTAFLCTMPGKVAIIPIDSKTRAIVEKRAEELKLPAGKIVMPKKDFIRHANPMLIAMLKPRCDALPGESKNLDEKLGYPKCCAIHYYRWHIDNIRYACFSAAEDGSIDSIGIDGGHQLSEDAMFACFGRSLRIMPRDRGEYNQLMRDLLYACRMKHFCITHHAQEIWAGADENSRKPTGRYDWKGWGELGYVCNVIVEHTHDDKRNEFHLSIRQCNDNPALLGADGENLLNSTEAWDDITFQDLAMKVFPQWAEEILRWE